MQTGFLSLIPYPVTEHATVYTAMKNFIKVLQQLDQKALPIFCDEGVYRIDVDIYIYIYISAWCKSGTRTTVPWDPGPPSKFKSVTQDPPKV